MSVLNDLPQWARRVKRDGVTLWFALRHAGTPWAAKTLAAVVVAYALSPIDLIPDVLPVIGVVDDLVLVPLAIRWLLKRLPPEIARSAGARR